VEAATRVLTLRYTLAAAAQPDLSTLDSAADRDAARAVAASAVTVLRGACGRALVPGGFSIVADSRWASQREWLTQALARNGLQTKAGGTTVRLVGYTEGSSALGPADVTVAMDTPYVLQKATGALVATYSSSQAAMEALAAVLAGKAPAPGRSPVQVAGLPATACAR
jgi:beta-N-acetylhexosaminidase